MKMMKKMDKVKYYKKHSLTRVILYSNKTKQKTWKWKKIREMLKVNKNKFKIKFKLKKNYEKRKICFKKKWKLKNGKNTV